TVEGEGEIIGDHSIGANPRAVEFGSAPVLVRSTLTPGRITLTARVLFEGEHTPKPVSIAWESVAPSRLSVHSETPSAAKATAGNGSARQQQLNDAERQSNLQEVEQQQTTFGETVK
ncbi:MAG: glycoside hydrolase family 2, partial [Prevotellaceae bacterium]|nr:glycoside hydrolase family 2 [Prevotellaceae bacterium]